MLIIQSARYVMVAIVRPRLQSFSTRKQRAMLDAKPALNTLESVLRFNRLDQLRVGKDCKGVVLTGGIDLHHL